MTHTAPVSSSCTFVLCWKMGKSEAQKQREEKRKQVVEVHRFMGDWKGKAKELKVQASTAYRWVSQGTEFKAKGRKTCSKVLDEHRDYMVTLVEGMFDSKVSLLILMFC